MGKTLAIEINEIEIMTKSVHLSITEDENGLRIYGFQPGTTEGTWEKIGSEKTIGLKFTPN